MARPDRSRAILIAFLLSFGVGLWAHPSTAVADPVIGDFQNGNKTATWNFENPSNYTVSGVEIGSGALALRRDDFWWIPSFATGGTADPQVTVKAESLILRGNGSSLVANGEFTSNASWTFSNSTSGAVVAKASGGTSEFSHWTGNNGTQFDSLDTGAGWGPVSSGIGASSIILSESGVVMEGTGSLRDTISLDSSGKWAGIERSTLGTWDLTLHNRVVVWLLTNYAGGDLRASLNLRTSTTEWNSQSVPVTLSWELAQFDIASFGGNLSQIKRIQLRFTGAVVLPPSEVYIDDVSLRFHKKIDETASIVQVFSKSTSNPGTLGSAVLHWNTSVSEITSLAEARLNVTLRHSAGAAFSWSDNVSSPSGWTARTVDVSSAMANSGTYTLTFSIRIRVNTHEATSALVLIDDVAVISPDYSTGLYVSDPFPAGSIAIWRRVAWIATVPPQTDVRVDLRTGRTTSVGDSTWSSWTTYTNAAGEQIAAANSTYLQFRARLLTSNSSRTPELLDLRIDYAEYIERGTIETQTFTPTEKLLRWRRFDASAAVPATTTITYEVSQDGVSWQPVFAGGDLSHLPRTGIQVRATLSTTDTSQSPSLSWMAVMFEHEGPLSIIRISPGSWQGSIGQWVNFTAIGYDLWLHPKTFTPIWETTDRNGTIVNGRYTPGDVGPHIIRALTSDRSVAEEVRVEVFARSPPSTILDFVWWPWSGVGLAAAAASILVWEVFFRYPHTLEDVFVIARDGRLVVHKTRRLRADRDEDIFAGMLTAITAFVRDSFKEEKRELDHFGFGDRTVYVERGEFGCVAAIYSGTAPPWVRKGLAAFVADLDRAHGDLIQSWSGDGDDVSGIRSMTEAFVERRRYAPPWRQSRTPRAS